MSFSEKRDAAAPIRGNPREPSESLQKVRRGEMSVDDYLDEAAEKALTPFKGKLASGDLETLRLTMREHLRTDPVTVELIRQLTGQLPNTAALGTGN